MEAHRQSIICLWMCVAIAAGPGAAIGRVQDPVPQADAAAVPRIGLEEFVRLHGLGGALVVDVRTSTSFKEGHIAGAIGVPLDQIARRAGDLRTRASGRTIVAYCACPDEHASLAAVRVLQDQGVTKVAALVGGFKGWVEMGGRVER